MDTLEVIEQPTDELDLVEQPIDETPDDEIEGGESKQATENDKVDGRKFNPEWSKALKELRELYPDKADMLTKMRDNYARFQEVQGLAPKGLDDIRAWKTTVDALGGPEAAADMMQRVSDMEAVDAKIEAGDDTFVDELPEAMQKGVYGMVPQLLNRLSEKDQAAFSAAVAPHFSAALAGTGLGQVVSGQIETLKSLYARTTDPEARAEIKALFDDATKTKAWFDQQTQGKGGLPGGSKSVDPTVQRLQTELDTRRAADDSAFVQGVVQTTNSYLPQVFETHAAVYLKQLGLSDAQKSDLMDSFNAKLTEKLGADTAFQKQLGAYKNLKGRTPDTVNTYIKGKIDESAKQIIDGLVTARYGGMRTKKTPSAAAGTATTENGATRVTQRPDESTWDRNKMEALGYEATAKMGIYHLANGKTVQVVRQ